MFSALSSMVLVATIGQVAADEGPPSTNEASLQRMLTDLAGFDLSVADSSAELTLRPVPALRWSYPIRNVDDAALFVWLGKDRPELVTTVMSFRDARQDLRRAYEFLSLSDYRLDAVHQGASVWHPDEAGVSWQPVPAAPAPADTSVERRRQLTSLAGGFDVAVLSDSNRYELRLLPRPLHRYQNGGAGVLDGALFAFVEGTDPELVLLLETRPDKPGWRFASGRLTRFKIEVRYLGRWVCEFPEMSGAGDISDAYWIPDAGPLEPAFTSPNPLNE
jgi:hypothetical protein